MGMGMAKMPQGAAASQAAAGSEIGQILAKLI